MSLDFYMLMCGYSVSFMFYWSNPMFNCHTILDNRRVMIAMEKK
jgi:hypothetical protein